MVDVVEEKERKDSVDSNGAVGDVMPKAGRRGFIAKALAAGAVALGVGLSAFSTRKAHALDEFVQVGHTYTTATNVTFLKGNAGTAPVFEAENTYGSGGLGVWGAAGSGGTGVLGYSNGGTGVEGWNPGNGVGIVGTSGTQSVPGSGGVGVRGIADGSGAIPILAEGGLNQTANLQEWRDFYHNKLAVVDKNGYLGIGIQPTAALHIKADIPIFRFTGTTYPTNIWHFGRFAYADGFTIAETAVGDWLTISGGSGNVGIGVILPQTYKLDVAGSCHATSFPTSSDLRFKEDVEPLTNVLERLEQVRGVTFKWNKKYASMGRAVKGTQIGVIAQEVEKAFPELVSTWSQEGVGDYRAVDYGRLNAVLVEALKELHKEVTELRGRLQLLEQSSKQPQAS